MGIRASRSTCMSTICRHPMPGALSNLHHFCICIWDPVVVPKLRKQSVGVPGPGCFKPGRLPRNSRRLSLFAGSVRGFSRKTLGKFRENSRMLYWEPPDVGLALTGVWRVPPPPPHCNWRTLPSSQTPSLPALSFPLPPTPLGSFCKAPGGGGPGC